MKKGDYVFVYGTLRKGQRMSLAASRHMFSVTDIGNDKINGEMYHIGSFPGVKASAIPAFDPTQPSIIGEVYRLRNPSIISILDAYECYDADHPDKGLYDRIQTITEKGWIVWVYIYNPQVHPSQRIESGDWVKNPDIPNQRALMT